MKICVPSLSLPPLRSLPAGRQVCDTPGKKHNDTKVHTRKKVSILPLIQYNFPLTHFRLNRLFLPHKLHLVIIQSSL